MPERHTVNKDSFIPCLAISTMLLEKRLSLTFFYYFLFFALTQFAFASTGYSYPLDFISTRAADSIHYRLFNSLIVVKYYLTGLRVIECLSICFPPIPFLSWIALFLPFDFDPIHLHVCQNWILILSSFFLPFSYILLLVPTHFQLFLTQLLNEYS